MAITWHEKYTSRPWHVDRKSMENTVDLHYVASGSEDDMAIKAVAAANIPSQYGGLYLLNYDTEPLGGGHWEITAQYGLVDLNSSTFSFDTTGASTHITQSLATSGRYGNAPDLKGAIGFDGDHVQGTDIQIPKYAWQEEHSIAPQAFTAAYKAILYSLTSRVNNATFRGFAAGEVQFQGATGSQRGSHAVEITYYFEASPNLSNQSIGGITVTTKNGFEYQWVRYKQQEDATTKRIISVPDGVYVEQIFETGDFSTLGIGVT